jgi:3-hydroxymyristoyl/3-hydroxydecanoyl-(acyl carrier protein) dehydratase
MGSALHSEKDLKFRNLGGNAILQQNIPRDVKTLTVRTRLTNVSIAGEMIIEHFDFKMIHKNQAVYEGSTYFGFFSQEALAQQVGIRDAESQGYRPPEEALNRSRPHLFEDSPPFTPADPDAAPTSGNLAMPAKALRMIDSIAVFVPNGGFSKLGFIRGVKSVDPDEWFFKAHFHQDPVWPGSLGIESYLQLMKYMALSRWENLKDTHTFALTTGIRHNWTYRGQVTPTNARVEVEASVTHVAEKPLRQIRADGVLKVDGLYIYKMEEFGVRLIPLKT